MLHDFQYLRTLVGSQVLCKDGKYSNVKCKSVTYKCRYCGNCAEDLFLALTGERVFPNHCDELPHYSYESMKSQVCEAASQARKKNTNLELEEKIIAEEMRKEKETNEDLERRKFVEEKALSQLELIKEKEEEEKRKKKDKETSSSSEKNAKILVKEEDKLLEFLKKIHLQEYFEKMKSDGVKYEMLPFFLENKEMLNEYITKIFHKKIFMKKVEQTFGRK